MEGKLRMCLLLIILGTLAVQGARLENKLENPFNVGAKRSGECSFANDNRVCCVTKVVVVTVFNYSGYQSHATFSAKTGEFTLRPK